MEVLSSGNSSSDRLTTRSGRIPELSLGLSLSDTSTQSFNHLISNVHSTLCSTSSHVKPPPPLLVFQDTGRHVTDHVTSLDQDFPGVNKVLQEMACFIKSSRNSVLPNMNTTGIIRPPAPPLLSTLSINPPIRTTTVPEPFHLPNIPMRPFVPRLIDPKQVLGTSHAPPPLLGTPQSPPPLLLLKTDPLINNRQLLLLPQEIKEHCDNRVHVTMTTGQSQRRLRRHSYRDNRQKATPTNNEESINYSSLQSQLINTRPQSNNSKPQSDRHSVTTPILTPDPPVSIPVPSVLTPVLTPDSPVPIPDPPLTTPDPPVLIPDPPVLTPDSPVIVPDPPLPQLGPPNPIIIPDPPVIGSDPQITPDPFTSHQSVGVQCVINDHTASNQYLIVTDIEDDDHTSTEGSYNIDIPNDEYYAVETPTKGSYDHVKYSNEFCNEYHLLGVDNNKNHHPMDKFKYLEDQLLTIEYKTCNIEQELTDSRKVLRTIERLSTEETKIISNNQYNDDHTHQLPHPLIPIPIPLPVVQDSINVIDDPVQTGDKRYRTVTTVNDKDELKVWMRRKRKERMNEYKRERERLIAKERQPYTPQKQVINRGLISTETAGNNEAKRRLQRANDYANRLKDAEHLLSDIVTTPNKPPPSSPYRPIQSAILLNTLPGPSRKNHTPSTIKYKPEDKDVIGKRRLSSVEGLSEAEQLKMAEILDSNRHYESSVESSNIDWSHIDQLLLSV